MAVAMEVAWRDQLQVELDGMRSKKRAWGADTEKLMDLMRGHQLAKGHEQTLDLLGLDPHRSVVDELLEPDSDQPLLPSGWEKCLDLKTGELYFVSKSTGVRTSEDPRKAGMAPRTPARPAHEFLASKRVEALRASTPSGSSGEEVTRRHSFATGKRLWSEDRSSSWPRVLPFANSPPRESNLELNLNLSPSPSPSPLAAQTVCTMEMVQHALRRSEKAQGKREATSATSSFSSLAEPSWSRSSPSPSSSSCSAPRVNCEAVVETSTSGAARLELVMAACTRCPMIVMVNKQEPKCPRCESEVGLESFSAHVVPLAKRPRGEAPHGLQ